MDIPLMLRQIGEEDFRDAIVTIKQDIALPAVLGRICTKPCEKGCRRRGADGPVAVCELKRHAADLDMADDRPHLPACKADTGKRVAVVGAGSTGLAAAYYLRQKGHAVTVFDDRQQPGGRLRDEFPEEELPRDVLDGEIDLILRLGIETRMETAVGEDGQPSLGDLIGQFDAVLLACGAVEKETVQRWGLEAGTRGIKIEAGTYQTPMLGVFAAGNAIRGKGLPIRSVADGKEAAGTIDQFLAGAAITPVARPFSSRMGKIDEPEWPELMIVAADAPQQERLGGVSNPSSLAIITEQADRCLACGCQGHDNCRLERYAAQYGADPGRFQGQRRHFEQVGRHSSVLFEPGKCINCALCIQIAQRAGEPLGLTFVGRGFDVRVAVPFNKSMEEALGKVAAQCVAACPTAALSFTDRKS